MIWFFIAGWISGAVFIILYAKWWVERHTITIRKPDRKENVEEDSDDRE